MDNPTIDITVLSVTPVSPNTAQLTYLNGGEFIEEASAGNIVYTLGTNCQGWSFVGIVAPTIPADITWSVTASGSTLTIVDTDTVSGAFNFCFQLSNGTATYTSQDPIIFNDP